MRRSEEFSATVRGGAKGRAQRLVVHLRTHEGLHSALVGFIVPRSVGIAVVRNRVKRRLRAAVAQRLDTLPSGSLLVVRALPASAEATYAELEADLERAIASAQRSRSPRRRRPEGARR